MSFPSEFLCPITGELMRDPVMGTDGHSYERSAISAWLASHSTSPITREPMYAANLTPNYALRSQIERLVGSSSTNITPKFKDATVSVESEIHDKTLHLRVTATGPEQRQPLVLIGIIDKSGSMDSEAGLATDAETQGFTRMDLVKHAVRAQASVLGDNDMFGIISFNNAATVELRPTLMTTAGKQDLFSALDRIHPEGGTNIWDGVRQASLIANEPQFANSNVVAMLLTDGLPNENPPRGILPTMKTLKKNNPWSLHAFGFGYQLDSDLLAQIASWGSGIFGFIPDCSMVGTVMINFMATALCTASRDHTLRIQNGDAVTEFHTGPIIHGQSRDFYFPISDVEVLLDGTAVSHRMVVPEDYGRFQYMKVIASAISNAKSGRLSVANAELAEFEAKFALTANETMKAYLRDIRSTKNGEGQIGMAPQYFQKWGEHYMRSYLSAQNLQQCMNFKDPGLQIYGGNLFRVLQDVGDTAFITLPAPKPSRRIQTQNAARPRSPVNMAVFHNSGGGCFAGDCRVQLANGEYLEIKDVAPGTMVWTPTGAAKVLALVTCGSYKRSQSMVQLGELCITPYHPIINDATGKWVFPCEIAQLNERLISTVYNLVLANGHIINVEGYRCITLAHGFTEPVAAHEFFGTEAVVEALKKQPGWAEGRPIYKNLVVTRDENTGMINDWVDEI